MNFLKNNATFLLLIMLGISVSSCSLLGEDDDTYTGPAVVGFALPNPPKVEASGTNTYEVQLIRSQQGVLEQDLAVSFEVVSTTTAPEGSYQIQTSSPVTMPSGSLTTKIDILYDPSVIPAGDTGVLEIHLLGNEERGIKSGENIGVLHVVIVGQG